MKEYVVYQLKSLKDNKFYIGSTNDLERRLKQHNSGQVFSTKSRRPFVLRGYQNFTTIETAAKYEKKYKKSHDALNRAVKRGDFILIGV